MSQISLNQMAYIFPVSLMSSIVNSKLRPSCNSLSSSLPTPKFISVYQLLLIFVGRKQDIKIDVLIYHPLVVLGKLTNGFTMSTGYQVWELKIEALLKVISFSYEELSLGAGLPMSVPLV